MTVYLCIQERIETFVIPPTNTRHPAKRFQMNTLRHLGIRQEEKGLRAKKVSQVFRWNLLTLEVIQHHTSPSPSWVFLSSLELPVSKPEIRHERLL